MEANFVESLSRFLDQIPEESESYLVAQDLLGQLYLFLQALRSSSDEDWDHTLNQFKEPARPLFNELGKLVRTFHDQLKAIDTEIPERLGVLANHDMPDASARLQQIVTMTEQAANKTLDVCEALMTEVTGRDADYSSVIQQIDTALASGNAESGTAALKAAQSMLTRLKESDAVHNGQLTEILIAQDYQDLTGQLINRIVVLLEKLEKDLIKLIETFGHVYGTQSKSSDAQSDLKGPLHSDHEDRQSQDDVNNLLASLGF